MKRLFFLVLAAAQSVVYLIDTWTPPRAVRWIRELDLSNVDGPYLVLRGLRAIFKNCENTHNHFFAYLPFSTRWWNVTLIGNHQNQYVDNFLVDNWAKTVYIVVKNVDIANILRIIPVTYVLSEKIHILAFLAI